MFSVAQEWVLPAETDVAVVIPDTLTGVVRYASVPSPSWPAPLSPQHLTVALLSLAHVCSSPPETAVAVVIPDTATGAFEFVVVPLPSWPSSLAPQHRTVPSASAA